MTRFNYRPSWFERIVGRRPDDALAFVPRAAVLAVGAALAVLATVFGVESRRLAALDDAQAALQTQLAESERSAGQLDALAATVARLTTVRDAVIGARLAGTADLDAIARIGNELPDETWLTGIQAPADGAWSIAGRSTGVDHIGTLVAALEHLDPAAAPRLLSINATGHSGRVLDFAIALERAP